MIGSSGCELVSDKVRSDPTRLPTFGPLWTTLGSHGVALGALLALLGSSKGLPWTQFLDFRVILEAFFTYFLRLVVCVCVASSSLDFPSDFHEFPWIFDFL